MTNLPGVPLQPMGPLHPAKNATCPSGAGGAAEMEPEVAADKKVKRNLIVELGQGYLCAGKPCCLM